MATGVLLRCSLLESQNHAGETPLHLAVRAARYSRVAFDAIVQDPYFQAFVKWACITDNHGRTVSRLTILLAPGTPRHCETSCAFGSRTQVTDNNFV
jgi:hypothetical protein